MNRRGFLFGLLAAPFAAKVASAARWAGTKAPVLRSLPVAGKYFDLAAATSLLKEFYSGQRIESMIYRDNPLLTMLRREDEVRGRMTPEQQKLSDARAKRMHAEHRIRYWRNGLNDGYARWREVA